MKQLNHHLLCSPPSIRMRLARPEDAEYIHSLRINPGLNRYLSPAAPSVEEQRRFLESYMAREQAGKEFYFVIQNKKKGTLCGTVRLYDFLENSFCWGSWILDQNKSRTAAIESALFVYDFAFGYLAFPSSHFDVRRENLRVIEFHERFGAERTGEDEQNVYFKLDVERLREKLPELLSITGYRMTSPLLEHDGHRKE